MSILFVSDAALRAIQVAIAQATHTAKDSAGNRVSMPTLDSRTLDTAARMALQIATGELIWNENEPLRLKRPKPVESGVQFVE